jgi:hypothetical protein
MHHHQGPLKSSWATEDNHNPPDKSLQGVVYYLIACANGVKHGVERGVESRNF